MSYGNADTRVLAGDLGAVPSAHPTLLLRAERDESGAFAAE